MPTFKPKGKKKDTQPPLEEKKVPAASKEDEEELKKLQELEKKFSQIGSDKADKGDSKGSEWEPVKRPEADSGKSTSATQELRRPSAPPKGAIGPDNPEYISKETLDRRRREVSMSEAKLRNLEREEQDINKRLEFLRREHSAMELAIKEKAHLEREIAELREDRDRVKSKLDELKEMEGKLLDKSWDELKASATIGPKISTLERRIHELEGQILDLKEKSLHGGQPAAVKSDVVEPKPEPVQMKQEPVKKEPLAEVEQKPADKAPAETAPPKKDEPTEKKPESKKEGLPKKRRTRIGF